MAKQKERRNPLAKEHFLEGNRQKWCAVFTAIGLGIMGLTAYGMIKDPTPFMGYFTGIGVTFILGASGTALMSQYKLSSHTTNENRQEEITETYNENINIKIEGVIHEGDPGAPLIRPFKPVYDHEEEI